MLKQLTAPTLAALSLIASLAPAYASPLYPTQEEYSFLDNIRSTLASNGYETLATYASNQTLLDFGYTICGALDSGKSISEIVAVSSSYLSPDITRMAIGTAIPRLCPQQRNLIRPAITNPNAYRPVQTIESQPAVASSNTNRSLGSCTIDRTSVSLRTGAGTSSGISQVLNPGDRIQIHSYRDADDGYSWAWVTDNTHGKDGWLRSDLVGSCE